MRKLNLLLAFLVCSSWAYAQYPIVPDSLTEKAKEIERLEEERLAKVWEKAYQQIQKEGKPYIPWAHKPEHLPQADIPAFPGAEGGGAYTFGGRGGKVYVVTSLEDSGPGTLREAVEAGGARTIVFNVAGVIHLEKPLSIRAPYVTIAGQTAPGDGICIAGESLLIDTHDVVLRFLRFRRGAVDVTRRDDAIGGEPMGNVMIDHVSASWGLDETISIYRHVYDRDGGAFKLPSSNITIQNCIISESLDTYNHSFGSTIGGLNSTFMRNLWASNISRNPSVGMFGDFTLVNNVMWNWWNRSVDGGDNESYFNIINNYFKPGPITPKDKPIAWRVLKPETGRHHLYKHLYGKAYIAGNITEGNDAVTKDNWNGGVQLDNSGKIYKETLDSIRVDTPAYESHINIISAQQAYNYVLENSGAFLPKRDAVDTRIVKQVRENKAYYEANAGDYAKESPYVKRRLPMDSYKQGIITDINQVGGLPEYKGEPYKDSDNDGIPDDVEIKMGLDPNNPNDSREIAENGYSHIENYLNSVVPVEKVSPSQQ